MLKCLKSKFPLEKRNYADIQIKELQKICDLSEFYSQKRDIEELAELDNKFHHLIYEASGSKMLNLTLSNLHIYVQQARFDSFNIEDRRVLSVTEHTTLLDALRNRDAAAAEKAMTYHVSMAHQNISSHSNS
jgi:DNA-binding GntR family transcriptional regulator